MDAIGVMPVPADFRYLDVFLKGKPQHDRFDTFRVRHPIMDVGHRAKFFSPFDAAKAPDTIIHDLAENCNIILTKKLAL